MSEITEEIKKALEAATPGPWESTNLGDVHITKGYRMVDGKHTAMWIADMCEDREDEEQIFADAWLIANAPTWLRTLLEENERLTKAITETSLSEKLLRADVEMFRAELDQLKELQTIAAINCESLRTELSEKDKVLEWIRDAGTDYQSINKAREVLFQFKKGDTTDDSKDA